MLLEIKCPVKGTVGSNPTLSASKIKAPCILHGAFLMSKNIKKQNLNTFWTQMIILVDYKDILIKVFDIGIVLFFY